MDLVLDANVLLREVLTERGLKWLSDQRHRLTITNRVHAEFEHYIALRVQDMIARHRFDQAYGDDYVRKLQLFVKRRCVVVDVGRLVELEQVSRRRIPDDADDWPTAALAMSRDLDIVSEDKHFWGCGLRVWRVRQLLAEFNTQREDGADGA